MRWLRALGAATLLVGTAFAAGAQPLFAATASQAQAEPDNEITVLTRNLYLGADVGIALDLLPDLSAAAQFMWDQVAATDFDARAPILAEEAAQNRPDVIALQEATTWLCTPSWFGTPVPVFDFTQQFLDATTAAGVPYVIAQADGAEASNPGFRIGPLPGLTVTDPATFQPLFGKDTANCGFQIGDVLLVRADLADSVRRVGTSEFDAREVIVPTVLALDRGYVWADIELAGTQVRFVSTHLESRWQPDQVPTASVQARQLVADLADTTGPLLVMGDFNSDPRDPHQEGAPGPSGQPTASDACPAQVEHPDVDSAEAGCSPYWVLREAGFTAAGPNEFDPVNYSWGASALLAGPDPGRLSESLAQGNPYGFTNRLDYVFGRNGVTSVSGRLVGNVWPDGPEIWPCNSPDQIANTAAAGEVLTAAGRAAPASGTGQCLPSDHAGVVATVAIDPARTVADDPPPIEHDPFRLVWWQIAVVLLLLAVVLVWWLVRRRRRKKRARGERAG